MPDNDVWPPKPTLPDPLAGYDELIEGRLNAPPSEWPGYDRFKLVKALREENGLDWLRAFSVARNYHLRHSFQPTAAASVGASMVVLSAAVFMIGGLASAIILALVSAYLQFQRGAVLSQPNHRAALAILIQQEAMADMAFSVVMGVWFSVLICLYLALYLYKRHKK